MTNYETEIGFTKIANDLFEAIISANLKHREQKVLLAIVRYTCGFNREEARLSVRYLSVATGIRYQHISKALSGLVEKNIIKFTSSPSNNKSRTIYLIQNYNLWEFGDATDKASKVGDSKVGIAIERVTIKEGTIERDSTSSGKNAHRNVPKDASLSSTNIINNSPSEAPYFNDEIYPGSNDKNVIPSFQISYSGVTQKGTVGVPHSVTKKEREKERINKEDFFLELIPKALKSESFNRRFDSSSRNYLENLFAD